MYGWIQQGDDGNYIPQENMTIDEGSTVNLAVGYQKGRSFSTTSGRVFNMTTSGTAGMQRIETNGSNLTRIFCFADYIQEAVTTG